MSSSTAPLARLAPCPFPLFCPSPFPLSALTRCTFSPLPLFPVLSSFRFLFPLPPCPHLVPFLSPPPHPFFLLLHPFPSPAPLELGMGMPQIKELGRQNMANYKVAVPLPFALSFYPSPFNFPIAFPFAPSPSIFLSQPPFNLPFAPFRCPIPLPLFLCPFPSHLASTLPPCSAPLPLNLRPCPLHPPTRGGEVVRQSTEVRRDGGVGELPAA
ncbi:unnamed protein product [Closterium sp. NIES-64]|nr:unnamed protein product [Closterium sp. NIES-64]